MPVLLILVPYISAASARSIDINKIYTMDNITPQNIYKLQIKKGEKLQIILPTNIFLPQDYWADFSYSVSANSPKALTPTIQNNTITIPQKASSGTIYTVILNVKEMTGTRTCTAAQLTVQ